MSNFLLVFAFRNKLIFSLLFRVQISLEQTQLKILKKEIVNKKMRVLYFGSDALSLQVLTTLHKRAIPNGLISEIAVVTPLDRMAGKRQRVLTPCVLKTGAKDLGIHNIMDAPVTPIRPPLHEWDPVMKFQQNEFKGDLAIAFSFGT